MKNKQLIAIVGIFLVTTVLIALILGSGAQAPSSTDQAHTAEQSTQQNDVKGAASENHQGHHAPGAIEMSPEQASTAGITIARAEPAEISSSLTLPGEIRFNQDRTAHIVPRVDGIVENVTVDIGQQVKKDQLLAIISSTTISELRSDAMAAQKRLGLARTIFEREKELWLEKISAEQDYLQAQQALQEAEINVQNTSQKLQALGTTAAAKGGLNRYELRAPFGGLIVERHITLGESTQANVNVMTLADLSSVWAEIVVSARDLNHVKLGSQVTVKATSLQAESQGVVSFVGALLGEQTRTATARVTLPNPDASWRPGLFVEVEVTAAVVKVPVSVTAEALQTLEGQTVVFVPNAHGYQALPVQTGRSDGKKVEITSGLQAGAAYVSHGSFVLKSELGKESAGHEH
ncbi:MAG: efflux RND transporter periplasmic adaptor subunit [Methylobacillus glycogenes]|nr:efflux RND transporter periplasmic adaptor subunit [Methylobacillus glycogenes]